MNGFDYGFVVDGGPTQARRVCRWRPAFEKCLSCDGPTGEGYLSAFQFDRGLVEHVQRAGTVAGYAGPTWTDWIPIDIDGAGADPVPDALDRARRLVGWLEHACGADLRAVPVWFSGSKGFHAMIPSGRLGAQPGPDFNRIARAFVAHIGWESGAGPDLSIYDRQRIFRSPNSRHARTGLYKVMLRADSLIHVSVDAVRAMAANPQPSELWEPEAGREWADWTLPDLWRRATDAAREQVRTHQEASSEPRTELCRDTLRFIRDGAANGERAVRLFRAAANLAELGADERLAGALLRDAALDSGLSPSEVTKQIHDGVAHVRGAGAS